MGEKFSVDSAQLEKLEGKNCEQFEKDFIKFKITKNCQIF
jgi:hypothetical protein